MKLIIVRHGETYDNINEISQGQRGGRLTEEGRRQARLVGERLKDEKIDFIYSSDLRRTKDTLKEILKFHDSPVVYTPLLRERGKGELEGLPHSTFREARDASGFSRLEYRPPSGESLLDLLERANEFWKIIQKDHKKGETILICSHGMFMASFYRLICGRNDEEILEHRFFNTSVTIIDVEKKPRTELYNCISHLES